MGDKTAAAFVTRERLLELAQKWADAYAEHGVAGSIVEYTHFRQALDLLLDPDIDRRAYLEGPLTPNQAGRVVILNQRMREVAHPDRLAHEECADCAAVEKALTAWFAAHLVDEGPVQ